MNKIFTDLSTSSDLTELLLFMDKHHPEIVQESVLSKQEETSFFIHFSYGIYDNYEKIKSVYEINKKYGYDFNNTLNKKNFLVNDLYKILSFNRCHDKFIIDCLNTLPLEQRLKAIVDTDLLLNSFKNNKILLLKELSNYPEVWKNKSQLKSIENNHLTNFELSEIYSKNMLQDNIEIVREQCKEFIKKELKDVNKYNADDKIEKLKKYVDSMIKKDKEFPVEFKEEIVGLSLLSPITKVTSQIIKLLFNEKLSTYKPDKPLWIHFESLKNKDILYEFLDKFNFQDYYEDKQGKKHYKIDYLEKALKCMNVDLQENKNLYRTDNKTKRDGAISNNVFPLLKEYWLTEVDGTIGFAREILKEDSIFKSKIKLELPEDINDTKKLVSQTLLLKQNNKYVFLEKAGNYINQLSNLKKVFELDLLPVDAIKTTVEKFNSYNFESDILDILKQKVIDNKMELNLEPLLKEKTIWGVQKTFLEQLEQINQYNIAYNRHEKMKKRFESIPEQKEKRIKI